MDNYTDSTSRTVADYFLFALGFAAFLIGSGGIVLTCAGMALTGSLLFLLVVACFHMRAGPPE